MTVADATPIIKVAAAAFLLWLTTVMLRAPAKPRPNRILAAFLAVLALGFLLEYFVAVLWGIAPRMRNGIFLARSLVGLVDPPLLLAFALSLGAAPRRRRATMAWIASATTALGLAAILALYPPGVNASGELEFPTPALLAEFAFVSVHYLLAYGLALDTYLGERRRFASDQLRFLSLAVGFAALSRLAAVYWAFGSGTSLLHPAHLVAVGGFPLAALALAGVHVGFRTSHRPAARRLADHTRGLAILLAVFFGSLVAVSGIELATDLRGVFTSQFFPSRWVVVALLMGLGILRHQLFDFELQARKAAALLAAVAAGIAVAFASTEAGPALGLGLPGSKLLGLAGAVAAAGPVYLIAVRWAQWWGPASPSYSAADQRRAEVYEALLEDAPEPRAWSESDALLFEALREVLEITPEQHQRAVASVQGRRGPPVHPS